jgi:hypothetical protein
MKVSLTVQVQVSYKMMKKGGTDLPPDILFRPHTKALFLGHDNLDGTILSSLKPVHPSRPDPRKIADETYLWF